MSAIRNAASGVYTAEPQIPVRLNTATPTLRQPAGIGFVARKAREHDVDSPSMSAIRNAASGETGPAGQ